MIPLRRLGVILKSLSPLPWAVLVAVLISGSQAAPAPAQVIRGPSAANVSQEIRLVVDELVTPELADAPAWAAKLRLEVSAPEASQWLADPELTIGLGSGGLKLRIYFAADKPGVYCLVLLDGNTSSLALHRITVGGVVPIPPGPQPDPTPGPGPTPGPDPSKISQVTLVYEKSLHAIPPPVAAALNRLNRQGILATAYEQDSPDGTGSVPTQYRIALTAAKAAGLPCLVVQAGETVVRVKTSPKTDADVTEAIK